MRVFLNGFYLTLVHYPEVYPYFVEPEVYQIWGSQFKNMKLGMKANIQFWMRNHKFKQADKYHIIKTRK